MHFFVIFFVLHVSTSLHLFLPFLVTSLRPSHCGPGEGTGEGVGEGLHASERLQVFTHIHFFLPLLHVPSSLHVFFMSTHSVHAFVHCLPTFSLHASTHVFGGGKGEGGGGEGGDKGEGGGGEGEGGGGEGEGGGGGGKDEGEGGGGEGEGGGGVGKDEGGGGVGEVVGGDGDGGGGDGDGGGGDGDGGGGDGGLSSGGLSNATHVTLQAVSSVGQSTVDSVSRSIAVDS